MGELGVVELRIRDAEGGCGLNESVFAKVNARAVDLRVAEKNDVAGAELVARDGDAGAGKFVEAGGEMDAGDVVIHAANEAEGVHAFAGVASGFVGGADPFGGFALPGGFAEDGRVWGVGGGSGGIGWMVAGVGRDAGAHGLGIGGAGKEERKRRSP